MSTRTTRAPNHAAAFRREWPDMMLTDIVFPSAQIKKQRYRQIRVSDVIYNTLTGNMRAWLHVTSARELSAVYIGG